MDCPAFVGLDLRTSAIIIAVVGMVHWIACAVPSQRFRSEFFVALYVLAGAAGVVSFLLFVGILASNIVLYWVWIVFTLVYVAAMVVALLVMLIGFNTLRMRGVALMPLVALLYYILTLYFVCVVNSHRREVQRSSWVLAGMGVGRAGGGASNASTEALRDPTATTAVTMPNTRVPRRGRCAVPSVDPPNGEYHGALPNKKFAQPNRRYHRLRLWVSCDEHHRPRHLPYALCYSGGWNLPLPDCVRDKSYYEVNYYHDDYYDSTEAASAGVCVLPRPPDHGYFTREKKITKTHISLAVRCNSLHYLVGWQRLTCRDGHWNRPMPKCMFMDITVCTLLKRTDGMIRTCLASEHYEGTYRCDQGVVPHGTAVEPRCRRDYFVWGPFRYMHCLNGEWHPRDVTWQNIICEHTSTIYRHYEIEERKTSTTPGEPMRIGDNATTANATDTFGMSIEDDDDWAVISPQMEEFFTRNFTNMGIWKRKNKTEQSNTKLGKLPEGAGKPLSTNSANKKLRNPQIYKAQGKSFNNTITKDILQSHRQAFNESLDDDSIRTNFWKLQKEALKADAIDTSLWKTLKHAGVSINKADKTKIRNVRNEIGKKPITNSNKTYLWTSQTEDHSKLRAKTNQIGIWKSECENHNHSEILKTKSNKISIWKPPSQTSGSSSTTSNELSIWKSHSEDFGNRFSVNTSKISIWKTENAPSDSLGTDWTKNNIRKSQEDSDKLVHPNLNKIKSKHFRKKASKWLGMHSDRLLGGR